MVAGLGLAFALLPRAALAHAQLLGSDPSPEALLDRPPAGISLTFTEAVIPAGSGIKVFSPAGRLVAAPARAEGRVLTAAITSPETGTYVVSWQVLAADTHPSRGSFRFVVGEPSDNPYAGLLSGREIGTVTPLGFTLQALARWMHFAGVALVFGVVAYQALIRREPRLRRLVGAGLVLLIAAEPLALVAQLASLSFDGDTAIAVLASGFGRLLGLRLAVALLVWALLALESPWPVLGLGMAMVLIDGAAAHPIPGLTGAGPVLDAVHLAAMGIWAGGLAAFLLLPDRRFVPYALGAFAVAAGSGALLALAHVGSLPALVMTDYGRALAIKVSAVAAAGALAVIRRRRIESVVVGVILAVAAVLVSLPPPR